jgi:hypothetical protein
MQVTCPQCNQVLELPGERPKFCAYCGQALPTPPADVTVDVDHGAATLPPAGPVAVTEASMPQTVGGYRLVRELGRGGMGAVYEAADETTGRRVALKLIAPQLATPEGVARFRQEGRLAALIAHPRCVFVLAADEEAGRPYIVMELMPGPTLADLVEQQGPLPPEQAVAKILDVMEGLESAHQRGVIHRDVKPSNCFLDGAGRVKVGDFGLAKSLTRSAHLTRTGSFLGTPLFSSPEQVRGERVDEQSDVYAVAATLYYLLTGQAPFQSGDPAVTLARIAADPPPSLRSLRPELPLYLDRVVLRGLERSRERRWRNLAAFRDALLPFVPGQFSISGLGIRFGAYVIDQALFGLYGLGIVSWMLANGYITLPIPQSDATQVIPWLLDVLLFVCYYTFLEGIWGCSAGKWLLGLRVWAVADSAPPGLGRAFFRTSVFTLLTNLNTVATLLIGFILEAIAPESAQRGDWVVMILGVLDPIAYVLGIVLLVETMRARNGYRGLHDFASGTRVVRLPPRAQHRGIPSRPLDQQLSRPEELPDRVGNFAIRGALRWNEGAKLLLGEDEALGRVVLVWLHSGADTPPGPARRELARPSRLRWLAGGQHGELSWDAFQAPMGCALSDLVAEKGRLSFRELGPLLEQLTGELMAACAENTLPGELSVEQCWVQAGGQVLLLDTPLGDPAPVAPSLRAEAPALVGTFAPAARASHPDVNGADPVLDVELLEQDDQERALALLDQVVIVALEGRPRGSTEDRHPVRAALPGHATSLVNRLLGTPPGFKRLKCFEAELRVARERPAEVTRSNRAAHLTLLAVFLFGGLSCIFMIGWMSLMMGTVTTIVSIKDREQALQELDRVAASEHLLTQLHPSPLIRANGSVQWERDQQLRAQLVESLEDVQRERERRLKPLGRGPIMLRVLEEAAEQSAKTRARQAPRLSAMISSRPFRARAANLALTRERYIFSDVLNWWTVGTLAFWPVVWVLWAFLTRGGLSFRLLNIALVRADGRPVSRLQCAARALLVWTPVTLLLVLAVCLDDWYLSFGKMGSGYEWLPWASWGVWWSALLLLPLYVILALRSPGQSWHDRRVGTYLVPK